MLDLAPPMTVEEEYLLLDAATCRPAPLADRLLSRWRDAAPEPREPHGTGPSSARAELVRAQLEVATPVCRELDQVREHVGLARRELARLAGEEGLVLAPLGAAPLDGEEPVEVTPPEPFAAMGRHSPGLAQEGLLNGMTVRVEVPARDVGVSIMNRLRPWLHLVLAVSANSPIWRGRDTGFASWRAVQMRRWPVEGPPPLFADASDYDCRLDRLRTMGVLADPRQANWSARLAEGEPAAVEIRVSDVQLDVDAAVMVVGLTRALVARALRDCTIGVSEPQLTAEVVRAAGWHAARYGAGGELIDLTPAAGGVPRPRPGVDLVAALLDHVAPVAADEFGDIMPALAAALVGAGGADRQRRALAAGGVGGLLDLVRAFGAGSGAGPRAVVP